MVSKKTRCEWSGSDPLMIKYHDHEWGVPVHDDRKHFEFIVLESFQAGLSWATILKRRENFREAFDEFDPVVISAYTADKIKELKENKGIIRNKLKIESTVTNAAAFLKIQKEYGSFDEFIWKFVNNRTIQNRWHLLKDIPAKTNESDIMSSELKKRGFRYVGSTICYAYMQAVGLVNDHTVECFRQNQVRVW